MLYGSPIRDDTWNKKSGRRPSGSTRGLTVFQGLTNQRLMKILRAPALLGLCFMATPTFAGPVECYSATPSGLSAELSVKLCAGATSNAPVTCYNATPSQMNAELSVALCAGAESNAPISCYAATPSGLSAELSVQLCAGAK